MATRPFHSIQALRAIAALLVVLFHLQIVEAKYTAGMPLLPGFIRHADSGVDLFFVLSGFVMTTIAAGSYGSPRQAGRFLVRRSWRVLPPYWFYTTVVVVLMLVAPGIANSAYQEQSVLASYLLWPQPQLPLLTVGWTLIHEMFFYLVMAGMIAFARETWLPALLLGWGALTLAAHFLLDAGAPWQQVASSPLTLEFIAGALVGLYWRHLPAPMALPVAVAGALGLAGAMLLLSEAGGPPPSMAMRLCAFGLPAALLTLGLVRWERAGSPRVPLPLLRIGDSSYSLYLSHVFVISAAGRLWHASGWNHGPCQSGAFIALTVLACIGAGWASWRWLEQPLQRLRPGRRTSRPDTAAASG